MKMQVSMLGGAPRATRSLGGILIESGQLTPEDAERVLQLQKDENLRFGAAAVNQAVKALILATGYLRQDGILVVGSPHELHTRRQAFVRKAVGDSDSR